MVSISRNNGEDRIALEKEYENGISTRSFFYHFIRGWGSEYDVALAFTDINPNAIVGFYGYDAGVTHKRRQLRPTMRENPISDIMTSKAVDGEIATLRYEWNINDIKPRN